MLEASVSNGEKEGGEALEEQERKVVELELLEASVSLGAREGNSMWEEYEGRGE